MYHLPPPSSLHPPPHTQLGLFNGRIWSLRPSPPCHTSCPLSTSPPSNLQQWRVSIHSHALYGNSPVPKKVSENWALLHVHTCKILLMGSDLCMYLTISQSLVGLRTLTWFTRLFCHWKCMWATECVACPKNSLNEQHGNKKCSMNKLRFRAFLTKLKMNLDVTRWKVKTLAVEFNPGHSWLELPVLCHWAPYSRTTTRPHNP